MSIDEIVKKEPKLKYAPFIAAHTFCALLQTDPHKAYEFGKVVMMTPTYEAPDYHLFMVLSRIEAAQKAIDMLKSGKGFSKSKLAAFEAQLQEYRRK